ncbi:hypothetical protein [uncultured Nocardioides sp.]|uniref:hypothetical protein n=1 Tax=uncultured Nocardioides sp. TaxID=198441 RepID=UPI002630153E|nr:hypothetical protein [uncultured Nocardioides sp.]
MSARTALLAPLVLVAGLTVGCGDQTDRYCDAVTDNQDRLGEIAGSGDALALFEARDVYRDLAEEAPDDIADDWDLVLDRIDVLEDTLDEADVDPATYDPRDPPSGLSSQERARIRQAADDLAAPEAVRAMDDVEQQALDVCGTPLRV